MAMQSEFARFMAEQDMKRRQAIQALNKSYRRVRVKAHTRKDGVEVGAYSYLKRVM